MRYSVFVYIYALRGFVLNDPERWYGFMSFAERLRDNSPYDYEEENRFARRADPAANPDGFQVLLVKPSQFEEAQVIADSFGAGQVIVLNLDAAARDIARRVLDFLSGAAQYFGQPDRGGKDRAVYHCHNEQSAVWSGGRPLRTQLEVL